MLINPRPTYSYEWLFIMRHYGISTRLLDWTESPLVGTYFTVNEPHYDNKDGVLWALSPIDLNKQSGRQSADPDNLPSFAEDLEIESYKPEIYADDISGDLLAVAICAPRNTQRMQSQSSAFTIHHRNNLAINKIGDASHIWRYIIPAQAKPRIKKELELLSIGEFHLFPELDKLNKKITGESNATN